MIKSCSNLKEIVKVNYRGWRQKVPLMPTLYVSLEKMCQLRKTGKNVFNVPKNGLRSDREKCIEDKKERKKESVG